MSKTKKNILAFAVIFAVLIIWFFHDIYRFYNPYRNTTSQGKEMYRNFDVVVIEVTVDDKDGILTKAGLDTELLKKEALKTFEQEFHRFMGNRDLKISLLDHPYNLDNHPQAFVVSLHLAVTGSLAIGYHYREDMKIVRKMKDGIRVNTSNPMSWSISSKDNLKQMVLRDLHVLSAPAQFIAHWN
jgi:hypothetical protein